MSFRDKVTLDEVCSLIADCPHSTPVWTESGYLVIRNQNIKNGKLDLADRSYTDHEHYLIRIRRAKPQFGDLILTREAPMGEVCMIPNGLECCVGQRQVLLRPNTEKVVPRFLLYAIQSPEVQHEISWNEGTGSTVSNIRIPVLKNLQVPLLPLKQQKEIATFLGALDDRIALLRETNATLEAIAQALFKSWFVDFEPVHAKARGESPQGMDDTTATLFPDSFEESELGMIPKGWRVGELQDLLVLQRGFDLPASKRVDGEFPLVAASGPNGTHNIAMARAPGIVTGRSGVLGKVFLVLEDYWPLNTTLWVKEFKRATPSYAYEIMRRLDFASFNAGSAVPTLNRNHVHSLKYLQPPSDLIQAFESIAILQHQRAFANSKQAQTLAQLRDTLLPKLISGQLRLPEAEELLAEELP
ncbi:restriction endonuclease subunit S [Aeromonas simiae]|uniref:restriction endonuclease subunit S n=1 Tax=Aeromonas simiae TaxID=218936 RepID=UPI00266BAF71|nr:restriction endonuclease subunit S [Aeromonas simiae]MDO2949077.1 restriction endonuclease subunit S [Aeromonas simiae]MDO2956328.1 restriction endonuclease subunit S [Aeromonas simiae]